MRKSLEQTLGYKVLGWVHDNVLPWLLLFLMVISIVGLISAIFGG